MIADRRYINALIALHTPTDICLESFSDDTSMSRVKESFCSYHIMVIIGNTMVAYHFIRNVISTRLICHIENKRLRWVLNVLKYSEICRINSYRIKLANIEIIIYIIDEMIRYL